ncbi:MAG: hypothetical protein IJ069_05375 [Prevotella sp.]|nr:hypothetical protein [Prevotella sp.]
MKRNDPIFAAKSPFLVTVATSLLPAIFKAFSFVKSILEENDKHPSEDWKILSTDKVPFCITFAFGKAKVLTLGK